MFEVGTGSGPLRADLISENGFVSVLRLSFVLFKLIPWIRGFCEKLTVAQLVKKSPSLHGILRFIIALTTAYYWSLFAAL
jgi:hypothetical protein